MPKHKRNGFLADVPEPVVGENSKMKFSFEFYDITQDSYCLRSWGQEKIGLALQRLKEINEKPYKEIKKGQDTFRFRPVIWKETIKKNGFPDYRVNRLDPFHFALVGVNGQKARVFGAFADNVFFIVWFDLNHEIWPSPLKNT